eukprot:2704341-Rhodomonas_salina.1
MQETCSAMTSCGGCAGERARAGPMGCRVEMAAADPDGNDEDADEDENQDGNEGGGSDVVVPPGDDDVKEPSEEGRQAQVSASAPIVGACPAREANRCSDAQKPNE